LLVNNNVLVAVQIMLVVDTSNIGELVHMHLFETSRISIFACYFRIFSLQTICSSSM
jgi:hypothetical protein